MTTTTNRIVKPVITAKSRHFKYNCPKLNGTNDPKPVNNAHQTVVICRDFNNQAHSNCGKPTNKCSKGRLHKCFVCKTFSCKSFLHRNESTQKVNTNMTETELNHTDIPEDILRKVNSLLNELGSE